jgi:TctA family transporter
MMEEYLRRALILSRGDPVVFLTSPISAALLALSLLVALTVLLPVIARTREEAFSEEPR